MIARVPKDTRGGMEAAMMLMNVRSPTLAVSMEIVLIYLDLITAPAIQVQCLFKFCSTLKSEDLKSYFFLARI